MEQNSNMTNESFEDIFDLKSLNSDEDRLNKIKQFKERANKHYINCDVNKALEEYMKISNSLEKSEDLLKNEEIKNQYKLICSNIAMCLTKLGRHQESIKYDLKIFQHLDRKFHKSYARLMSNYLILKNVTMANYFASMLSHSCDKVYQEQYKDILNEVDMEKKKQQKGMNELLASAMSGSG
jgi:hypothetical protein